MGWFSRPTGGEVRKAWHDEARKEERYWKSKKPERRQAGIDWAKAQKKSDKLVRRYQRGW